MTFGKVAGIVFSMAGVFAGAYFGISPILETQASQQIIGQQAGIYFAIIGTIISLCCAAIGVIFNSAIRST